MLCARACGRAARARLALVAALLPLAAAAFSNQLPDYIKVCKRDQSTINACVRKSIETLRPKLVEGMPELKVPPIEPFYIPELVIDGGNLFKAVGENVQVSGAGNFSIKSLTMDLETLRFSARVRFPRLHFEGRYSVEGRVLLLPLSGAGTLVADAVKCDAEILLSSRLEARGGEQFLRFTELAVRVALRDYRARLDGLFAGNKVLGDAANEAINQSREEIFKAIKPYAESTISTLFFDTANKIASTFPYDQLIPA